MHLWPRLPLENRRHQVAFFYDLIDYPQLIELACGEMPAQDHGFFRAPWPQPRRHHERRAARKCYSQFDLRHPELSLLYRFDKIEGSGKRPSVSHLRLIATQSL